MPGGRGLADQAVTLIIAPQDRLFVHSPGTMHSVRQNDINSEDMDAVHPERSNSALQGGFLATAWGKMFIHAPTAA
jgi:hypothetical protein